MRRYIPTYPANMINFTLIFCTSFKVIKKKIYDMYCICNKMSFKKMKHEINKPGCWFFLFHISLIYFFLIYVVMVADGHYCQLINKWKIKKKKLSKVIKFKIIQVEIFHNKFSFHNQFFFFYHFFFLSTFCYNVIFYEWKNK